MDIVSALTEPQVDQVIQICRSVIETIGAGINTLWTTLSPILLGYLAYRQSANRREIAGKIDVNTEVSTKAFETANGHNEKIAAAMELTKEVHDVLKTKP
jgi:hypothetical protein